tara:strand:+ start:127 stop:426 length:300 start_codon:yes stop_codon:yes gene_type:complete
MSAQRQPEDFAQYRVFMSEIYRTITFNAGVVDLLKNIEIGEKPGEIHPLFLDELVEMLDRSTHKQLNLWGCLAESVGDPQIGGIASDGLAFEMKEEFYC